jgi:hypothetical protein
MKTDAAQATGAFRSQPRQKLGLLGGELLRRETFNVGEYEPRRRGGAGGDVALHPSRKREFGSFAGVLRPKVRDRYADESDALGRREDGPDQAKGDLVQPVPGFNARFH